MNNLLNGFPVILMGVITVVATVTLLNGGHYIVGILFFSLGTLLTVAAAGDWWEGR
jgi:hypothetical protein